MPFFSVCIPNYNYAAFVGDTIQSVLDQTFQDFEIIVVDNASTDNSAEVIQSFSSDKVHFYQNNYNIGFAPNLQRATSYAKGDYLILLSSDDIMYPNALATYKEVIDDFVEDGEDCIIHSMNKVINQDGKIVGMTHKKRGYKSYKSYHLSHFTPDPTPDKAEIQNSRDVLRAALINSFNPTFFLTTCYSRTLWQKVEGYDPHYTIGPDHAFNLKILSEYPIMIYVHKPLFGYRVHESNQMAQQKTLGALKEQMDSYIKTFSYPQTVLDDLGLSRNDLIKSELRKHIFRRVLSSMADHTWLEAVRVYLFGLATYPIHMLKMPHTYSSLILILLGPVSNSALSIFRKIRMYTGWNYKVRNF